MHKVPLILFLVMVVGVICSYAQPSASDIQNNLNTQWTTWKQILKTICTIICAIGGIAVVWAYMTNRQESKDHLIKWVIGLAVIGILTLTVLS